MAGTVAVRSTGGQHEADTRLPAQGQRRLVGLGKSGEG